MPDPKATTEELDEIVERVTREAHTKLWATDRHTGEDTVRAILTALASRYALVPRGALPRLFNAGFDISGEGWNGEYGADTEGETYVTKRQAAMLAAGDVLAPLRATEG